MDYDSTPVEEIVKQKIRDFLQNDQESLSYVLKEINFPRKYYSDFISISDLATCIYATENASAFFDKLLDTYGQPLTSKCLKEVYLSDYQKPLLFVKEIPKESSSDLASHRLYDSKGREYGWMNLYETKGQKEVYFSFADHPLPTGYASKAEVLSFIKNHFKQKGIDAIVRECITYPLL